ncbi:unnamed protein product [Fraxinus pennsylvanica]|uniref:GDSL esterase/lipase n=1 Tax=Fraxinus pennsylvanica TaxID=56036 RepID=A0AAD1ZVF6_9LAMI|nr:unnamed protein product [Fraxinus pennsylvanica]
MLKCSLSVSNFVEVGKGCCGTGLLEVGPLCTPSTPVCENHAQYLFWDSIHPGESTYRCLSQYLAKQLLPKFTLQHPVVTWHRSCRHLIVNLIAIVFQRYVRQAGLDCIVSYSFRENAFVIKFFN